MVKREYILCVPIRNKKFLIVPVDELRKYVHSYK